jgi:hypothetical protein
MDSRSSASRRILTVLAILIVVTAFILIGINAIILNKANPLKGESNAEKAYKQGYEDARKKFQDVYPNVTEASYQVSGKVLSVNKNSFTILQENLATNPYVDDVSDTRTILLTVSSTITTTTNKDDATFQKELQAFMKNPQSGTPPMPTVTHTLKLSDLNIGDRVTVSSLVDVRLLEKIEAQSVLVQK